MVYIINAKDLFIKLFMFFSNFSNLVTFIVYSTVINL